MAAICGAAATARADVPELVWTSLKEREIIVETSTGEVRGKLLGIDAKSVVIMKADGTPTPVLRSVVKAVRAAVPDAAAAAPAATPSATPSGTAAPPAAPTPTATPEAEPEETELSPSRPHPELEKLLKRFVLLWVEGGGRVTGQLTSTNNTTVVVKTRKGTRTLERSAIQAFEQTQNPADSPASAPYVSPAEGGESTDGEAAPEPSGDEAPRTRGMWISGDLSILGVAHTWVPDFGGVTLTSFGLSGAPFNFGLGYQTSRSFLFGVRVGFQALFPEGADTQFTGKLAPRFEFPFGTGTSRGFFAVEPGLVAIQTSNGVYGAFQTAMSAGAHLFTSDSFSIDPYAELGYQRVFDAEVNTVSARVGLMLSGWMWSKPSSL